MSISLTVETRTEQGKKLEALRAAGKIPAVLYGPKDAPVLLAVDKKAFDKVLKEAGESSIVSLEGLGAKKDVLIHEVAFDPERGGVIHADFYAVEAGKEISVHIPLEFVGEAPAVKLGGTLTKVLHEIEVTCTPDKLPQHIDVDVSALDTLDKQILISDLKIPAGVKVEHDAEDVVVLVQEVAEESEEPVVAVDMSAIEVTKKGKTEEEVA